MVVTFVILFVICMGAGEANKRFLLEDNYYAIVHRLEALETKSQVQDAENAQLKREIGKNIIV